MSSPKTTRKGGRSTGKTPEISLQDEFSILEDQAIEVANKAGVKVEWAELADGDLALIFWGGRLCPSCSRPFIGNQCWSCENEIETTDATTDDLSA